MKWTPPAKTLRADIARAREAQFVPAPKQPISKPKRKPRIRLNVDRRRTDKTKWMCFCIDFMGKGPTELDAFCAWQHDREKPR